MRDVNNETARCAENNVASQGKSTEKSHNTVLNRLFKLYYDDEEKTGWSFRFSELDDCL